MDKRTACARLCQRDGTVHIFTMGVSLPFLFNDDDRAKMEGGSKSLHDRNW